jgi:hypothetical protein
MSFESDSTVVVVSLVSRNELNGIRVIVQNFVSGSGRYGVQVHGEQASVALKPGNLQPVSALGSTVILVSLMRGSDLNGRRGIVHGLQRPKVAQEPCIEQAPHPHLVSSSGKTAPGPDPRIRQRIQIDMFRTIRLDHTNCLQVSIKTHHLEYETTRFEVKVNATILSLKSQNLREVVSSNSGARGTDSPRSGFWKRWIGLDRQIPG